MATLLLGYGGSEKRVRCVMSRTFGIMAMAALLAFNLSAQGRDEDYEPRSGSENRGPTLGVARVSLTDGDVRLIRASRDAVQAQAGMPVGLGRSLCDRGQVAG